MEVLVGTFEEFALQRWFFRVARDLNVLVQLSQVKIVTLLKQSTFFICLLRFEMSLNFLSHFGHFSSEFLTVEQSTVLICLLSMEALVNFLLHLGHFSSEFLCVMFLFEQFTEER